MLIKNHTKKKVGCAKDIAKILKAILEAEDVIDQDKEHFWVVGLTTRNYIKYIELATIGILNQTIYSPREVYRNAIMQGCAAIITAHNHPSGEKKPSPEDKIMFKILNDAGELLGIKMVDSIIIAGDDYFSAANEGMLFRGKK